VVTEIDKKAPIGLIIFGALSFIPFIGVLIGLVAVIIGLTNFTRFKVIFILGASGIGLTILIFGSLFFIQQRVARSGIFDDLEAQSTEMFLNNLSNELQSYKCKYGKYPDSLEKMSGYNSMIVIEDTYNQNTAKNEAGKKKGSPAHFKSPNYFYKVEKDTFILFSVGKDGKPFTKDDIYPHTKYIKTPGDGTVKK